MRRANEPERICSESAEEHAIEVALQQNEVDKFKEIYNAAKMIRTELEKMNKWKFSASFSNFIAPTQLSTLIRCIVFSPKCATENMSKKNFIKKIRCCYTSGYATFYERQVTYEPKTSVERDSMYSKI